MMDEDSVLHDAACHCGAVQFRVRLSDGLNSARRCDCSLCRMRGAVAVSARVGDIVFVQGEENLSLYQFNTKVARHYFCKTCGVYTHHQRRSDPGQFGVNVACIAGMSPFDFPEVLVMNGVVHPSDADGADRLAGVLRFSKL
ncbi:GFA family protein [Cypionkella sp.]|uniref:GFA family protein n=1 Tax=Cypionkella sp. TaxID=2811411 RepID=UPI002AB8AB03|nr:GFA family protein [Cypionkella sp.]MDZ4391457.1 GFA family protein [Cypionkella sp.]